MALLAAELCAQPARAAARPWRANGVMQPIGIFGGTFDPIHCGHLRTAFELWQELRLAEVRLLPAGTPPHRDQLYASAEMRLQMVRAAVADQPHFVVDDREVRRTGPSYSVDTLTELRREYPAALAVPAARHGCLPRAAALAPLARTADLAPHRRGAPPRLACARPPARSGR